MGCARVNGETFGPDLLPDESLNEVSDALEHLWHFVWGPHPS